MISLLEEEYKGDGKYVLHLIADDPATDYYKIPTADRPFDFRNYPIPFDYGIPADGSTIIDARNGSLAIYSESRGWELPGDIPLPVIVDALGYQGLEYGNGECFYTIKVDDHDMPIANGIDELAGEFGFGILNANRWSGATYDDVLRVYNPGDKRWIGTNRIEANILQHASISDGGVIDAFIYLLKSDGSLEQYSLEAMSAGAGSDTIVVDFKSNPDVVMVVVAPHFESTPK